MRLYLASTSPARLSTLRAAGIEPIVVPSEVDEDAVVAAAEASSGGSLSPIDMVLMLGRAKAEAVSGDLVDGFVLGADSAFELDGVAYGKPHEPAVARERWLMQRGRTGHLHTGHWIVDHRGGMSGRGIGAVSTSAVTFSGTMTDAEIDAYVATGEPLEVAGAFTIDSLGAAFITAVEGDPHAVVGLSVSTLRELLRSFEVDWPSLWNRLG